MFSQNTIQQFLNYKYFLSDSLANGLFKNSHTPQPSLHWTFPSLLATCSTNLTLHSTHNFTQVVYKLLIPLLCNFSILLLFTSKHYSQHPALKRPQSGKPTYTYVTFHSLPDS